MTNPIPTTYMSSGATLEGRRPDLPPIPTLPTAGAIAAAQNHCAHGFDEVTTPYDVMTVFVGGYLPRNPCNEHYDMIPREFFASAEPAPITERVVFDEHSDHPARSTRHIDLYRTDGTQTRQSVNLMSGEIQGLLVYKPGKDLWFGIDQRFGEITRVGDGPLRRVSSPLSETLDDQLLQSTHHVPNWANTANASAIRPADEGVHVSPSTAPVDKIAPDSRPRSGPSM